MEIPYGGKVNIRLVVKRFKNKVYYYVWNFDKPKFRLKPCILSNASSINTPFLHYFNEDMQLDRRSSSGANWCRLFGSFEDAEKEVKRLNSLYFDGFQYKPFLSIEKLEKNKEDLIKIEQDINKFLKGFENFNGVDFCDVSASGIQIRGHHKQIKGYTYGSQPTIKYDFSNKEDVIMEFIEIWYKNDEDKKINRENEMIRQGEKWGWD